MKKAEVDGKSFGRLTVVQTISGTSGVDRFAVCKCACGKEHRSTVSNLLSGATKSCGCLKNKRAGMSRHPTGVSWQSMMTRCYNDKVASFKDYGGRGIKVCARYRESAASLIEDIGPRSSGMTIDRIDTNGNYSCGRCEECLTNGWILNVRWATRLQQNRNQRDLNYLEIEGERLCLSEWAERAGLPRNTIITRVRLGWTGKDLLKPARAKIRQ
jgi:hypothetical protein